MDIKKLYDYVSIDEQLDLIYKSLLDTYDPPTVESIHWKNWSAFWNLLRTECDVDKIAITSEHTIRKEFYGYIGMIYKMLNDLINSHANFEYPFEFAVMN